MPPCFGSFLLCVCRLSSSGLLMEMRPVIWIKNVFDWIPVLQGNFECCHLPPRPVPVFPPTIRHDSPANNRITVLLIEWSIPRSLAKDRAIQPPSWPSLLRGRTHTHTRSLSHTHTLPPPDPFSLLFLLLLSASSRLLDVPPGLTFPPLPTLPTLHPQLSRWLPAQTTSDLACGPRQQGRDPVAAGSGRRAKHRPRILRVFFDFPEL